MQSNYEEKKCDICRGRDIQGGCPKCLKYNNLRNNTFIDACQPQNEAKEEKVSMETIVKAALILERKRIVKLLKSMQTKQLSHSLYRKGRNTALDQAIRQILNQSPNNGTTK